MVDEPFAYPEDAEGIRREVCDLSRWALRFIPCTGEGMVRPTTCPRCNGTGERDWSDGTVTECPTTVEHAGKCLDVEVVDPAHLCDPCRAAHYLDVAAATLDRIHASRTTELALLQAAVERAGTGFKNAEEALESHRDRLNAAKRELEQFKKEGQDNG